MSRDNFTLRGCENRWMRTAPSAAWLFLLGMALIACRPSTGPGDAGPDAGPGDGGVVEYETTQYNSSLNAGYFTYPGYALNDSTYTCPGAQDPGYFPQPVNLYMAQIPGGGGVPLLLFFPGTYDDLSLDQLTSGISNAVTQRAAQLGFAAAAVAYLSDDGLIAYLYPDRIDAKEKCAFNSDRSRASSDSVTDESVIAQLCGNVGPLASAATKIDCSKGIFVAGHSQGGAMALLAKNYDPRVVAAYSLGEGASYDPASAGTFEDPSLLFCYLADPAVVTAAKGSLGCSYSGTPPGSPPFAGTMGSANHRVLDSAHIRAEAGDVDPYFADLNASAVSVSMVATRLNGLFNTSCPATSSSACAGPGNGSGWFLVGQSQLSPCAAGTACTATPPDSHAGHCFFSDGNSVGCVNSSGLNETFIPDPLFFQHGLDAGWNLDANLLWLKGQAGPI